MSDEWGALIEKPTLAFPPFPALGVTDWPPSMFGHIGSHVLIFYFPCFSSTRNITQEYTAKEAGHFCNTVKEPNLVVNSFGKAVLVNGGSADAIFKRILLLIVINFIQVM